MLDEVRWAEYKTFAVQSIVPGYVTNMSEKELYWLYGECETGAPCDYASESIEWARHMAITTLYDFMVHFAGYKDSPYDVNNHAMQVLLQCANDPDEKHSKNIFAGMGWIKSVDDVYEDDELFVIADAPKSIKKVKPKKCMQCGAEKKSLMEIRFNEYLCSYKCADKRYSDTFNWRNDLRHEKVE